VGCDECREAISAELDGEVSPAEPAAMAAHLGRCAGCRSFAERAAYVTRLSRIRAAEPVPDLVAAVLAAAPTVRRRCTAAVPRLLLGGVGLGQFALAVGGVIGTSGTAHHGGVDLGSIEFAGASAVHLSNESSAWNLALAVGFLWVTIGSTRVSGLVPVVGAFVAVLTALSALDVVDGRVDPARLLTHGLVVIGFVLLLVLQRTAVDGGGTGVPRTPAFRSPWKPLSRDPATWRPPHRADPGDGLRPTALHRAA
jgi:predicted anti-sigma-YlaC factor YlaD